MNRGTEKPELQKLIVFLEKAAKKNSAPVWKRVAELLKKPRRKRVEVNLRGIEKNASEGETVVVPGKVLGVGELKKKIVLAAAEISGGAGKRIHGATVVSIKELVEKNPKGTGVKIIV
jgi:large subunit ribosomal protein L18e